MVVPSSDEPCPWCEGRNGAVNGDCVLERDEVGVWSSASSPETPGFDLAAAGRLSELMAHKHFWLTGRRQLAERMLNAMSASRESSWIQGLELGCGSGAMLGAMKSQVQSLTGVDGHRFLLHQARQTHPEVRLLLADVTDTGMEAGRFDLIGMFDVLEHVDPTSFLGEARRLATDNADLLVSVPAFPSLWSGMDERAGHRCRYRVQTLHAELRRHGWDPVVSTHYQFFLFPLVWLSRRMPGGGLQHVERRPPSGLGRLLGALNAFEIDALARWTLPWGTSLFVWARAVAR